jgi:diguanylate cyclase (GGDEF)-like protein
MLTAANDTNEVDDGVELRAAPTRILILGAALFGEELSTTGDRIVRRVDGPMAAAELLSRARPDVIVIETGVEWQGSLIERIPRATRPAVLAVGDGLVRGSLADEWIAGPTAAAELESRLRLAFERAHERRRKNRQVFTDVLTGLPNRRAVIRALIYELRRHRRERTGLALALLDLDHFKQVNELQGHAAGDRLLRRVGRTLYRATRSSELCGRVGGDEFAVVLEGDADAAARAAERLAASLEPMGVSATTGAGALGASEQLRGLYRRVDESLRAAKRWRRAEVAVKANSLEEALKEAG